MKITLAMLWDILCRSCPELETPLYGSWPVRGIKLWPASAPVDPEYLYMSERDGTIWLTCGGREAPLNTERGMEEIFNFLQDAFIRLRDWDMAIHLALLDGCGVQEMLELSEDVLNDPVTVMDPSYKLLANTTRHAAGSTVFQEVCRRGYLPADTVEFCRLRGYMDELAQTGKEMAVSIEPPYVSVICPLFAQKQLVGYLSMPCVEGSYSEGISDCFHRLAAGVEQCMEKQLDSSRFSRYMYEYFLIDLIDGKPMSPASVAERLKYIDLPSEGRFRLLKLRGAQESPALSSYLAREVSDRLPNEWAFSYAGAVCVLLAEARLELSLEALDTFMKKQGIFCGVSRPFFQLPDIRIAHSQAEAALRLGRRRADLRVLEQLGVESARYPERIYPYEQYAVYHMVEPAAEAGLISPLLRELVDLDRREGSDHLRVLHGYLACERRPTQTAALLHMHRNNVIYRVGRIETLLGVSLDDPALREELLASLRALELSDSFIH